MIKVFTAQDYTQVALLQSIFEEQGLVCVIRNQYTALGRGEIPFTETWPELCILREEDREAAQALLEDWQIGLTDEGADWACPNCGEQSEGQFSACWNCSQEKPLPDEAK
jgi:predicted RNA-binding Zn-ribbon protein involved in translation (DUF1610 family)